MTQVTGVLQDATSKVMNGSKGNWTRYDIAIDGKKYQCKQDVFNIASNKIGQTIHAEVLSKQNGDFTNWYCNAVFEEHERGPSNAQERNPDNPAARAMNAQAASQGLVTELMRHESIARMAAVKHLNEAGFGSIATTAFLVAAKTLAHFYLTGRIPGDTPTAANSENRDAKVQTETKPFIPQSAIEEPHDFDSPQYNDDSIPF